MTLTAVLMLKINKKLQNIKIMNWTEDLATGEQEIHKNESMTDDVQKLIMVMTIN